MKNDSENIKITPEEFSKMNVGEKIMKMSEGMVPPPGKPEDQALDSLLSKIENVNPTKTIRFTKYFQAAAAVILAIIGFYAMSTIFSKEKITTKLAQQTEITLPDSSNVKLNASSKIIWSRKHFAKTRFIALKGEAFFEVKKGNKFTIETNNGTVEILGTQLNVFSRGDEFRVSCITGKVRVTSNNKQQTILPGEIAELTPSGLIKKRNPNIEQTISWTKGEFYFENKPLVSIFAELERQFDVSIYFENKKERLITVGFSNNNLKEALEIVCIPMGLNYEIQSNKKVKIYEKQK